MVTKILAAVGCFFAAPQALAMEQQLVRPVESQPIDLWHVRALKQERMIESVIQELKDNTYLSKLPKELRSRIAKCHAYRGYLTDSMVDWLQTLLKTYTPENGGPNKSADAVVESLVFTPDNSRVICGCSNGDIVIFEAKSSEPITRRWGIFGLRGHSKPVNSLSVSADSKMVVSSCYNDAIIRIWDAQSGNRLKTITLDDQYSTSGTRITPDGTQLIVVSWFEHKTCRLLVCDIQSGQHIKTLSVTDDNDETHHDSLGSNLTINNQQTKVAAISNTNIYVWDLTSPVCTPCHKLVAHTNWVCALSLTPDGTKLISASNNHDNKETTYIIWDLSTGMPLNAKMVSGQEYNELGGIINANSICVSPDGTMITCCHSKGILVWDLATGRSFASTNYDNPGSMGYTFDTLALSSDGSFEAYSSHQLSLNTRHPSIIQIRKTPLANLQDEKNMLKMLENPTIEQEKALAAVYNKYSKQSFKSIKKQVVIAELNSILTQEKT